MLIFVEGIDKSGKSTFIKKVAPIVNLPVYIKTIPAINKEDFHSYFKGVGYATVELTKLLKFDLIIDRPFISDWIYSNRYTDNFNIKIWQEWEQRIDISNSMLLYFEISKNEFEKRITNAPDEYMNSKDYDRYIQLYNEYLEQTSLYTIRINGELEFKEQIEVLITSLELNDLFVKSDFYASLISNCK